MLKKEVPVALIVLTLLLWSAFMLKPFTRVHATNGAQPALSFIARRNFQVEGWPRSVVVGDFDGDGIEDLAVMTSFNKVAILLGNGDGTFRAGQSFAAEHAYEVIVGDFNGDEIPDLALSGGSGISILLGNGNGTFQPAINSEVGGGHIATGDFNGDQILDLAVINPGVPGDAGIASATPLPSSVSILLGNGDGTFEPVQRLGVGINPSAIVVGDFNNDKIPDLAVANYGARYYTGTTVSILLGRGGGTFAAARNVEVGNWPGSLLVADLDGDEILDLAVGNGSIMLGNGDGTFRRGERLGNGPIAIGDFNGDGIPDLVSYDGSVLLGNGDGTFRRVYTLEVDGYFVVGDFNGDGQQDLAVPAGADTVSILLGHGDGTFGRTPDFAVGGGAQSVTVSILLGNGDGTFQAARDFRVGRPTYRAVGPSALVAVDLNRDSVLDLAVVNEYSSDASILLGNGDGTFEPALNYGVGPGPRSVAVGDFDGDGVPDLAVANKSPGTVSILLGNGDGTMRAVRNFWVARGPSSVAVGDFNGDGLQDLAVANGGYNGPLGTTVSILLGNGDGTFTSAQFFGVGKNPSSVAIGDFDGDGRPDLVLANLDSKTVSVLINTR